MRGNRHYQGFVAPYMSLTDTAVRKLKPGAKPKKVFDERGMYIEVSPSGGKMVAVEVPL